jgi:hypothetical protein
MVVTGNPGPGQIESKNFGKLQNKGGGRAEVREQS